MKKRWTVGGSASWVTRKKNLRESPGRLTCWWNRLSRATLFLSPWREGFPKTSYSWPHNPTIALILSCCLFFSSFDSDTLLTFCLPSSMCLCPQLRGHMGKSLVLQRSYFMLVHTRTHTYAHTHTLTLACRRAECRWCGICSDMVRIQHLALSLSPLSILLLDWNGILYLLLLCFFFAKNIHSQKI